MTRDALANGLHQIFSGIDDLKQAFPRREFTIDGRLVGDVGEVLAALEYDLELNERSQPTHDATTSDGRKVQIKATFKDSLTFGSVPDYYLGFKLHKDGRHEEIFNGPGRVISDRYSSRKGIGHTLLSFPIAALRTLSEKVPNKERIRKRSEQDKVLRYP